MPGSPARALAAALGLLAALALATAVRLRPPPPRGLDAPAGEFSAERALRAARALGEEAPRPVGSPANLRTVEALAAAFRALGLEVEVQATFACGPFGACAHVRNVLARLGAPGEAGGKAVALAAHHDSVPAGPGAADDLSGVSIVLEVARALRREPLPRPFLAIVTDAEEVGLVGAAASAAHPWAREAGAIVNLEARGTTGPSIPFETAGDPEWIGRALRRLPHPVATSLAPAVYELLPNDTDLTAFAGQGLPGVNLAFAGGVDRYHSPEDDLAHLDRASLQHQGENALALVRAVAAEDLDRPRAGRTLYFDVLGLGVVSWRGALGPAIAAALAGLAAAALFAARRRARLAEIAWGLGAALAAPLVAAGAALLGWLALRSGALPSPFVASPGPFVAAAWTAGLGGALLALAAASRRAGAAGLFAGGTLLWSGLAVALAVRLPGGSVAATVPAAMSGAVGLAWAAARRGGGAWPLGAALATGAAAGAVLLPVSLLLPDMLGVPAAPAVAAMIALVAFTAVPAGAGIAGRARLVLPAAPFAAAAALAGVQALLPPATPEHPLPLLLAYHEDASGARWVVDFRWGDLPPPLRDAAPFARPATRPYPKWGPQPSFAAPATPLGLPPPRAELLGTAPDPAGRRVRLRISSPRGAPVVVLLLPPDAELAAASMNGVRLPPLRRKARGLPDRMRSVACMTTPREGVELELLLAGDRPLDAVVMDVSLGLPEGGARLAAARPPGTITLQLGDATLASAPVRL